MKKTFIVALVLAVQTISFGQNNPKAQTLLNKVSAKLEQQKNISLEFKHTLENKAVDIQQTSSGSAIIKGDNYIVNYLDNIILYDSKNMYFINPENEEVNITSAGDIDENSMTPSKMLTFYKKGYTYQLHKKEGAIQYIKLVPTEESDEISHIILGVDTSKNEIVSLTEIGKNGTNTIFTITSYKTNQPLASDTFVFNRKKYIDLDFFINE